MSLKAVDEWWAKWQANERDALVMRPRGKPLLTQRERRVAQRSSKIPDRGKSAAFRKWIFMVSCLTQEVIVSAGLCGLGW